MDDKTRQTLIANAVDTIADAAPVLDTADDCFVIVQFSNGKRIFINRGVCDPVMMQELVDHLTAAVQKRSVDVAVAIATADEAILSDKVPG